jgi:uncharacterized protein DUF3606
MADNKKKRGGADRGLIALSEPYEVAYWSKKLSSCRSTRPPTGRGSR